MVVLTVAASPGAETPPSSAGVEVEAGALGGSSTRSCRLRRPTCCAFLDVARLDAEAPLSNGHDRPVGDEENVWKGTVGDAVTLSWDREVKIDGARFVFDSDLNNVKRLPCSYPEKPRSRVPQSLVKQFRLETREGDGSWKTVFREENNYQRLVRVPLDVRARGLRFVAEETWGSEEVRLFGFEALDRCEDKIPPPEEGPRWSEVVAGVDPEDLAAPESGLEATDGKGRRTSA